MKKFLLFAAAAVMGLAVQAQSVRFVHDGVELEDNATIVLTNYDPSTMMMEWYPELRNVSDKDVTFTMVVDMTLNVNNDALTMCDNQTCLPMGTPESNVMTIGAGVTDGHLFHTQFMLFMATPTSYAEATYYIMNQNDEDDFTTVHVKYDYPAYLAAVDKTMLNAAINLFQRGQNLVCNYKFDNAANRSVVVSSIVGARVAAVQLEGTNGEVVLNRLPKGVYVYTLVENGRNVKSHKIVVR